MAEPKRNAWTDYDYKKSEEWAHHKATLEAFRNKTTEEKIQSFIRAGILDENGDLTERYRQPKSDDE